MRQQTRQLGVLLVFLGQLDTRLDVPRTILVMRLFSRGTPTQFVKQTRQLCGGARVGWPLQGWSGRSGAAANSTAWGGSRVLGQLDTRLGAPRMILVMRLFSRSTPTQFVKQTRQLCAGARVAWSLQGWSVWRRPLKQ